MLEERNKLRYNHMEFLEKKILEFKLSLVRLVSIRSFLKELSEKENYLSLELLLELLALTDVLFSLLKV
jgi:hypothetical protein